MTPQTRFVVLRIFLNLFYCRPEVIREQVKADGWLARIRDRLRGWDEVAGEEFFDVAPEISAVSAEGECGVDLSCFGPPVERGAVDVE